MKAVATAAALLALTAAPAFAAPWGLDYAMATLIAYGGSDAEGRISVECSEPDSGAIHAGMMSISITPAKTSPQLGKLKSIVVRTGSASLELAVDRDGEELVSHSDDLSPLARRDLLAMLSTGREAVVMAGSDGGQEIARISLEGSAEQLDGFGVCAAAETD